MDQDSTKVRSYYRTQAEGLSPARERVMRVIFQSDRPVSRQQISDRTGMKLSSVCGRVNELLEMGFLIVASETWDECTSREVEALYTPDTIRSIKQLDKINKKDRLEAIEKRAKTLTANGAMVFWQGKLYPIERAFQGLV